MNLSKILSVLMSGLIAACAATPPAPSPIAAPGRNAELSSSDAELSEGKRARQPEPPLSGRDQAAVERRFRIAALETAQTGVAVSNDADQDVEPTVVALNYYGSDRTTVGFIKITATGTAPNFQARAFTSSTTNLSSWATPVQLPIPASQLAGVTYAHTADPGLAANAFDSGDGPLNVYCAGLAYNMNAAGSHPNGGVYVWRSQDGGASFPSTTVTRVAETQTPRTFDKPAIAVSWNTVNYTPDNNGQNGATVGQVYVAWVNAYTPANGASDDTQHQILFSRSTNGGASFSTPISIATGFVHTPQIVVPSNTGRVFVLYARYNLTNTRTNSIEMMRSTNAGISFSAPPNNVLSATRLIGPTLNAYQPTHLLNGTFGFSVFQARYNPGVGLQVVWHGEQPNNTALADVYYAYYNGAWTMTNLTNNVANDQFYPSFDYDASNNAVVTWYDRRNDTVSPNRLYQLYYMKIGPTGSVLQGAAAASATANDPAVYSPLTNYVGDYQDTWFHTYSTGSRWVSASVRINGTASGDILTTQITP